MEGCDRNYANFPNSNTPYCPWHELEYAITERLDDDGKWQPACRTKAGGPEKARKSFVVRVRNTTFAKRRSMSNDVSGSNGRGRLTEPLVRSSIGMFCTKTSLMELPIQIIAKPRNLTKEIRDRNECDVLHIRNCHEYFGAGSICIHVFFSFSFAFLFFLDWDKEIH